eukprot:TRINITY_DN1483_c0_g1_i1.p1 TRINITY_DN1483_c0_g1~~TRINITY_DN1483_c0_g1_i1.p1  ORF type:complete len:268 (-),score=21.35 TRINITY_DN1483_c0_g1_i1:49-774(-)
MKRHKSFKTDGDLNCNSCSHFFSYIIRMFFPPFSRGFLTHLIIYAAINTIAIFFYMLYNPDLPWFIFMTLPWLAGLLCQRVSGLDGITVGQSLFLCHLFSFLCINAMLVVLNFYTMSDFHTHPWCLYPLFGWNIFLSCHYIGYTQALRVGFKCHFATYINVNCILYTAYTGANSTIPWFWIPFILTTMAVLIHYVYRGDSSPYPIPSSPYSVAVPDDHAMHAIPDLDLTNSIMYPNPEEKT